MENIISSIPKKEIERLQAARSKVAKLQSQLADRQVGITDTKRKIEALESKVRDAIRDGGNPGPVTTEKNKLQRELESDELLIEVYQEAITDAENELKEVTRKVDHLLGQAVFAECYRQQAELQIVVDKIESSLHKYRMSAYDAAGSLGLPGPIHLPAIRLKGENLHDSIW